MRALLGMFGCAAAEGTSLRHGLAVLTQQCRGVLGSAQQSIGPSMQPLLSVCLATLPQPAHRLAVMLPQVITAHAHQLSHHSTSFLDHAQSSVESSATRVWNAHAEGICGCMQLGCAVARMCFLAEPSEDGQAQRLLFVDVCGASDKDQGQLQVAPNLPLLSPIILGR